jgi:MFS family permease
MVIVNTVVLVQSKFALPQSSTAMALMAFGGGSMVVALMLPKLLERLDDRKAMLAGGAVLVAGLILGTFVSSYPALILLWLVLGAGYPWHRHRPHSAALVLSPGSTCAVRRPVRPFSVRLLADRPPARGMVGGKRQPDGFVHRTESGCRRSLAGEQADLAPGV